MAKSRTSKFDVAEGLQYTQETQKTQEIQETQATAEEMKQILEEMKEIKQSITTTEKRKQGRPPKKEEEKLRGYRYNLNLDRDLKPFLDDIAWQKRTSITQYINDLIRADMQRYKESESE